MLGLHPQVVLTMCIESGARSRMHGLRREVVLAQAAALGMRAICVATTWQNYKHDMESKIRELKHHTQINTGVFGDIDASFAANWVEELCKNTGIIPCTPLWREGRAQLLQEFIAAGFKAHVIAVREDTLDKCYLGRAVDQEFIDELTTRNVDICGEGGEYHTVVIDGPIFKSPLHLKRGVQLHKAGYWFQDYYLSANANNAMRTRTRNNFLSNTPY